MRGSMLHRECYKSFMQNIIPKYSKDSNRVNQEGGHTIAEFPIA